MARISSPAKEGAPFSLSLGEASAASRLMQGSESRCSARAKHLVGDPLSLSRSEPWVLAKTVTQGCQKGSHLPLAVLTHGPRA